MQVTLTATHGTLTLATTQSLTFPDGTASGGAALTFTGSITAINAALSSLIYMPTADYTGSDTVSVTTNDLGYNGSGTPLSTTNTVSITVAAVTVDGPLNSVPSAQTTNLNTALVFSLGNGNPISIADAEADQTMQVTLTATDGTLTLADVTQVAFTTGTGINNTTMTFQGTVALINAALNGLTFMPTINYSGSAAR